MKKGTVRCLFMPKSDNQKLKILYILDHLQKDSNSSHPVKAAELAAMLKTHGIQAERKSIYSDIRALQDYGVDIITAPGQKGGYYVASRIFETPELKLLINAVQSSRFLTEKKSRELIEKLCTLCNEDEARLMRQDLWVSGRVKSMNESIYYNVDTIQDAIDQGRQITFHYFDWGLDGTRVYRDKDYTASPYGLCQDNENCYLLAHSPRHGITSYRVDRMAEIQILEAPRVPCPELTGKNLYDYAARRFHMFAGEEVAVKLRFHRSLTNVVMDRFGQNTMLFPDGDDHFVFTVHVDESPMFLSWILGFGNKAEILYPNRIKEACKALCREVLEQYGGEN